MEMFKYALGQVVYYVKDNKFHSSQIFSRKLVETLPDKENYSTTYGKNSIVYAVANGNYYEHALFDSVDGLAFHMRKELVEHK